MKEKSLSLKRFGQNRNSAQPVDLVQISPPAKPQKKRDPALDAEGLNSRQARFVRHYLVVDNATKAAILAGYSKRTAGQIGHNLLKESHVQAAIAKRHQAVIDKLDFSVNEAMTKLGNMARANMQDFYKIGHQGQPILDWSNLTRDQADALQELTVEEFVDGRSDKRKVRRVKFKLVEKPKAIELWGKFKGAFVEKHQHDHRHSGVVGVLLAEIDQEGRIGRVIEHQDGDKQD